MAYDFIDVCLLSTRGKCVFMNEFTIFDMKFFSGGCVIICKQHVSNNYASLPFFLYDCLNYMGRLSVLVALKIVFATIELRKN